MNRIVLPHASVRLCAKRRRTAPVLPQAEQPLSERIDIVVARNELPDLRGSMVIKTLQAERTELLGLLYFKPGPEGRIERYDRGQVDGVIRPFSGPEQLVAAVKSATGELATKAQERRIIQAFRADHTDFFRRFAKVKSQIDNLTDD